MEEAESVECDETARQRVSRDRALDLKGSSKEEQDGSNEARHVRELGLPSFLPSSSVPSVLPFRFQD